MPPQDAFGLRGEDLLGPKVVFRLRLDWGQGGVR